MLFYVMVGTGGLTLLCSAAASHLPYGTGVLKARLIFLVKSTSPLVRMNLYIINHKKRHHKGVIFYGREYWIRTNGILLPKQALYQAELTPDKII